MSVGIALVILAGLLVIGAAVVGYKKESETAVVMVICAVICGCFAARSEKAGDPLAAETRTR
jgi:hypothetical protein